MRKYLRRIARVNMQKQGIQHINRKKIVKNPITGEILKPSYFSEHWREYV